MKILLVIDVQNDFISGVLGNTAAISIIEHIQQKIAERRKDGYKIVFTRDTHFPDSYLNSLEGKYLPVEHCIIKTHGWQIADNLRRPNDLCIDKPYFGDIGIAQHLLNISSIDHYDIEEIEIIGFCTDICVIANALILKSTSIINNGKVTVKCDPRCCAGTSLEAHNAAITVMKSCQVEIEEE